jgi:hypothetical protein
MENRVDGLKNPLARIGRDPRLGLILRWQAEGSVGRAKIP